MLIQKFSLFSEGFVYSLILSPFSPFVEKFKENYLPADASSPK